MKLLLHMEGFMGKIINKCYLKESDGNWGLAPILGDNPKEDTPVANIPRAMDSTIYSEVNDPAALFGYWNA